MGRGPVPTLARAALLAALLAPVGASAFGARAEWRWDRFSFSFCEFSDPPSPDCASAPEGSGSGAPDGAEIPLRLRPDPFNGRSRGLWVPQVSVVIGGAGVGIQAVPRPGVPLGDPAPGVPLLHLTRDPRFPDASSVFRPTRGIPYDVDVVPEPSTALLVGAGLGVVGLARLRRAAAARPARSRRSRG